MSIKRHLTAGIALTLGLVVLSGSALAAPPSTPPGQEKKAEKQAEQAADVSESAPTEQNQGQEQKAEHAEQASNGINATSAGVKPSNSTEKKTKCWTGGSSSSPTCQPGPNADSSKRYGNGKTAAQIAVSRGAAANTEIRGPGNSQPHKVCKKANANGKEVWVDVHAVKSYSSTQCAPAALGTAGTTVTAGTTGTTNVSASTSAGSTAGAGAATGGVAGTAAAAGGVAGVATESGSAQPAGVNGAAGGVLGAFGAAGGVLPFTGFPLWLAIVAAIALIAVGWTLQRRSRPAARGLV